MVTTGSFHRQQVNAQAVVEGVSLQVFQHSLGGRNELRIRFRIGFNRGKLPEKQTQAASRNAKRDDMRVSFRSVSGTNEVLV